MSVILELDPDVEKSLSVKATARGVTLEQLLGEIVASAADVSPASPMTRKAANLYDLFTPVRGLFREGELDFSREPSLDREIQLP